MAPQPSLPDLKARLRVEGFARRDALDADVRGEASQAIAATVLGLPELTGTEPVGAYWPMRSEVDPRPALRALAERGSAVALPQTRQPLLVWRRWQPGDALVRSGFGVLEPGEDALLADPRALLVPLCCFDRRGGRLGYGRGHFDRSIADLADRHALLTIGIAFCVQEVDEVPMEAHDRRLDMVVTEREVLRVEQSS